MINVGVDGWRCGPVDEATLVALILDGANDLAPLHPSRSNTGKDITS